MAKQKVKIGIIGTGNISPIYVKNTKTFEVLDLVACADIIPEKAVMTEVFSRASSTILLDSRLRGHDRKRLNFHFEALVFILAPSADRQVMIL